MIQTIYIHKTLHLKGTQKEVLGLFKTVSRGKQIETGNS